jgi:hypothetical protein
MKIFTVLKEDEVCYKLNQALTARQLELSTLYTQKLEDTTSLRQNLQSFLYSIKYSKYIK